MSDTIEKLEDLKAERAALIKQNLGAIESLNEQNRQYEGEIRGLELAIKLCEEDEPDPDQKTPALIGKYANMGLTEAILDVLQTASGPQGLTGSELVARLESEGFKTQAKELYNSAYGVAMGLLDKDKIKEGKKDGKRTFLRKQPF